MSTEAQDLLAQLRGEQDASPAAQRLSELREGEGAMLRSSIQEALESQPESFARAKEIEAWTQIPAPVAERNLDAVDKLTRAREMEDILRSLPTLRRMALIPDNAKLMHDDLEPAGVVERAARAFGAGLSRFGEGAAGAATATVETLAPAGDMLVNAGVLPVNPAAQLADQLRGLTDYQARGAEALAGDRSGAGPVESGVYAGLESVSQQVPMLAAAVLTRNPQLALGGMATTVFGQEYGTARRLGVDPGSSLVYATSQSVIEYATERLPLGKLLGDLEKQTGLIHTVAGQLLTEIPQEQVATFFQDMNQWAVLNPEKPFSDYVAERPNAALETLVATLVGVGTQTTVAKSVDALTRGAQDDRARAELAEANGKKLDELVAAAQGTKLLERAPDVLNQLVQDAANEGEVTDVYVDARLLRETLQNAGIAPADAGPSVAAQLEQSAAIGGDVRIPLGEFASRVAQQDWAPQIMPHVRTSPDALSVEEAKTMREGLSEQLKAEAEKALEANADDQAHQQSVANVENLLREQLTKANRFTPDVNNAYAALMRDFYVTTADKLGVTPEEMYAQYPLRVTAENIAGAQMDQLAPEAFEVDENSLGQYRINAGTQANGEPVAFMDLEDMDDGTLQIKLAEVDEERRGEGIGQQLIQKAYELAQSRGKRLLSDVAVSTKQLRAYEALRRKGWTIEYADPAAVTRALGGRDDEGVSTMPLDSFEARGPVVTRIEPPAALQQSAPPQTETSEFKEWFGDSKVVDENGKPRVVYHGTNANFKKFNKNKTTQGIFWVTSNRAAVEAGEVGAQGRGRVMELYASIQNPASWEEYEKLGLGELKARGFDGAILDDGDGQFTAFAFEPTQLKSATRNSGAFDPSNPSILDQSGANRDLVDDQATGLTELAQGQTSAPRGQIQLDGKGGAMIALLQNADLSTFLHESGHFFLEVYADLAVQNAPIAADFDALLKWFGVESAQQWQSMTLEQRRPHHEKFARGFEAYLFEGKAPTPELNSLFSRFRAWLLNVYRSLNALNVELSDDVRGVMNRMIATEDKIAAAERARNFAPLFPSAEESGMTPEEHEQYVTASTAAHDTAVEELQTRSLRDMRWASRARGRELKKLQADVKEKRDALRDEAAEDVRAEPVYQAVRFVTKGELTMEDGTKLTEAGEHKLDRVTLEKMGVELDDKYVKRGGMHPDLVAEMFGFRSGDHLIKAIKEAAPIDDVIEAVTDRKMLERYGDLTDPQHLERAADEAVHNNARTRFVATELKALGNAMKVRLPSAGGGSINVTLKAAKEFAETTLARRKVRDVKPAQFHAAEARASKEAEAALAAGDLAAAVAAKRNQLTNMYATRASLDVQNEIEKGVAYLRKFEKGSTIDPDYLEQIHQLLERFDLKRGVTPKEAMRRKSLASWVDAQRALGFEPAIDEDLLAEARRIPYQEMAVEQFRGLIDTVRNVEHLGRLKTKLLTAQREREFQDAVDAAATSIKDNARKEIPDEIEHNSFGSRLKEGVQEFFAMHRKFASIVHQIDGFEDGGTLWDLLVRPLNAANDKEADMRASATKKLMSMFRPLLKTGALRTVTEIPGTNIKLSREGRLSVALNWGNETNRNRVMDGDKWTPGQAQAILDTLTKGEWDFVQGVWDFVDSYWPEIAAKEKRVTGLVPPKVEAAPVKTKFGELRGGYYPIKYDPLRSSKAEADSLAESLRQAMQGLYTRATTRRGHTKQRVDKVKRPIRKDLGVVFEHVEQVVHDLSFHEYLIDANRLLRAPAIDSAIRAHHGPQFVRQMRGTLEDVARGDVPAQNAFERALNHIRTGATIAGLGWNVTTSLLQPLGLTQSMARIGPKWVGRGLARWIGSAARMENGVKFIHDRSKFMKLRAQTMQREIREVQGRVHGGKRQAVTESFFYLIQKMQMVADVPTWLGMYEKEMEHSGDERRAIELADQVVRDAQGSGAISDLAAIQRGGPLMKLWTNFYSFFNTTYNLTAESVRRTNFKKPADVGRLAADYVLLYTLPATLAALLKAAMPGSDDDDELAETLVRENLSYMLGTMLLVREMGSVVSGYSYRGPAGTRGLQEIADLLQQAGQGEADEAAIKAAADVAGILFHLPTGQVERTVEGAIGLYNGDTENLAALISGVKD